MSIKILLADDHGVLRAGLHALLSSEPGLEVVGEADCGEHALRLAMDIQPDVLLMDIGMPDLDGIEVTRLLSSRVPGTHVLLLTMYDDAALLREAIQAGASGYIVKRAVHTELIGAIRSVAAGHLYIHPSLTRDLLFENKPVAPGKELPGRLTPREIEILKLIAKGHTNKEIAELLSLSLRTVETHRSNLRTKLQMDSRAELVRYAARQGLLNNRGRSG
jgi:two-component system response regulator NreC